MLEAVVVAELSFPQMLAVVEVAAVTPEFGEPPLDLLLWVAEAVAADPTPQP